MSSAAPLALVVVVFIVTSWLASHAAAALSSRIRPEASSRIHAGLALAPIALGAALALAVLGPELTGPTCHCETHAPHHPHVCLAHPGSTWPMLMAMVLVAAWLASVGPRLLQLAREVVETVRCSRWCTRGALADGSDVLLVPGLGGNVMTLGILRPVVVADAAVWRELDHDTRRAIAFHERGHALRLDGLTLFCLRFASAWMPRQPSRRLVAAWKTSAEMACDRFSAARSGDPCLVADALVQCGRLQAPARSPIPQFGLPAATSDDLELRVGALLAMTTPPASTRTGNDALRVGAALAALGACFIFAPGDATHHAVETLLGWLV